MEVKVKDHPGLLKDEKTGVVTNTDQAGLAEYRAKIAKAKEIQGLKNQVNMLEERVKRLEGLINERS
jgi:hypothetical protein